MRSYKFYVSEKNVLKAMDNILMKKGANFDWKSFACYQGGKLYATDGCIIMYINSVALADAFGSENGYFIIDYKNCMITETQVSYDNKKLNPEDMPDFKRIEFSDESFKNYIIPNFGKRKFSASEKDSILYMATCNSSKMIFLPEFFKGLGEVFLEESQIAVRNGAVSLVMGNEHVAVYSIIMASRNDYFDRFSKWSLNDL